MSPNCSGPSSWFSVCMMDWWRRSQRPMPGLSRDVKPRNGSREHAVLTARVSVILSGVMPG